MMLKMKNYLIINKVSFMPDICFRMLLCAPSGGGKTNLFLDMIYRWLYYDKTYLFAKNFQQNKYQHLIILKVI